MSTPTHTSDLSHSDYRTDLRHYVAGFVLAAILTIIPFGMVALGSFARSTVIEVITVLGLIQVVVHLRYFLHVDLSAERRDDLHLILFSALLLFIMAAGTIWILVNLQTRMMGM